LRTSPGTAGITGAFPHRGEGRTVRVAAPEHEEGSMLAELAIERDDATHSRLLRALVNSGGPMTIVNSQSLIGLLWTLAILQTCGILSLMVKWAIDRNWPAPRYGLIGLIAGIVALTLLLWRASALDPRHTHPTLVWTSVGFTFMLAIWSFGSLMKRLDAQRLQGHTVRPAQWTFAYRSGLTMPACGSIRHNGGQKNAFWTKWVGDQPNTQGDMRGRGRAWMRPGSYLRWHDVRARAWDRCIKDRRRRRP
jgi:hypothetical protein